MASRRALERAQALVGTRFRPQGRDPRTGLDCIGLVALAFRLPAVDLPDDYRLNGRGRGRELVAGIDHLFRRVGRGQPGNLVLMQVGRDQLHLGVVSPAGVVHADARRGVVVDGALPLGAAVLAHFRKRRIPLSKGRC